MKPLLIGRQRREPFYFVIISLALLTLSSFPVVASSQIKTQLIPNGSFEQTDGKTAAGWWTYTWAGRTDFSIVSAAHDGKSSILVSSTTGADSAWSTRLAVKPYSHYRITGWIKTEGVERVGNASGALLNLHARSERTRALLGTNDWTQVSMEVDTGADDVLIVNCLLGYFGQCRGKAWYDEIKAELMSTKELNPTVKVSSESAGEPISKYIYSQFIEHLGRCIYGGIWAEMLEDRKFYYGLDRPQSPWKTVGGATVRMVTNHPFVGEHTPEITASASGDGISQSGLALRAGMEVTGRIWLRGDLTAAPITVSLVIDGQPSRSRTVTISHLGGTWQKHPILFKGGPPASNARLEITSSGSGKFQIGTVSLMPADNVRGMRADTLRALKELDSPLYRWPGGNFVSGYDWRDGLGDPDRRPPRKNPAWTGIEHNDFGLHEFMDFCKLINTEPLVVVNTGFGDSFSAAQEVEYVNGAASTEMGRKRSANGRREPWGVVWWGVGNEMWGTWQLGYMALNQYVIKHNEFVAKMRAVDPKIKLVASGDLGNNWSRGMLQNCANQMDLLSEHFYCQEKPSVPGHISQIAENIREKARAHREYRRTLPVLKGKDIRIAMDEWNYWYGPHVFGELGTRYFLKDGLGIAGGLHEYYRNTDIIMMANYAQTVNVIGAIKTSKTAAALETTGLVLKLYRQQFGTLPVRITGDPTPLDVSAAWTADRKTLTIAIMNPLGTEQSIDLDLSGVALTGKGNGFRMSGNDPQAFNDPSTPDKVQIKPVEWNGGGRLILPPFSVTLWRLPARQ